MQFASYLTYRGVPVETSTSEDPHAVVMAGRTVSRDSQCVPCAMFVCHADTAPHPGDLVIVLPDDKASRADIDPYRRDEEVVIGYERYPVIANWVYPFVRRLHVASMHFAFRELPDRWMDGSVIVWK
jgi:hypothetical protein